MVNIRMAAMFKSISKSFLIVDIFVDNLLLPLKFSTSFYFVLLRTVTSEYFTIIPNFVELFLSKKEAIIRNIPISNSLLQNVDF